MDGHRKLLLDTLDRGHDELVRLVHSFPPDAVDRNLRPGEWNVRHHVHHLRQIEARYLERLEGVLSKGQYVPAAVQHTPPEAGEAIESMLLEFTEARRRALTSLDALTDSQWRQVFNHPTIWGDVTVEWWAERFVQHTASHLSDLWMLRQLSGLTGPAWERVTAPDVLDRL